MPDDPPPMTMGVCVTVCVTTEPDIVVFMTVLTGVGLVEVAASLLEVIGGFEDELELGSGSGSEDEGGADEDGAY